MIKTIIFDFNGTMVYDQKLIENSWMIFLGNTIHRLPTVEEFIQYIHGRNIEESLTYFFGENFKEMNKLKLQKEEIYRNLCSNDKDVYKLIDGLSDFLDLLKKKGYICAIATASGYNNIKFHYEKLGLNKWFLWENIIYNDHSFKGKPSPEIYQKCFQKLNVQPGECIVFEDSLSGIIAAKKAGASKVVVINKEKISPCDGIDYIISNYKNAIEIIE